MSKVVLYHLSMIARPLSRLIILIFILYFNALPNIKNFSYKFESNNLQGEVWGEKDIDEKEIYVERPEKKDQIYSNKLIPLKPFVSNFISDFNPDILIPPPKYS